MRDVLLMLREARETPIEESLHAEYEEASVDMWAALGGKLDSSPWALRSAIKADRGLELWRQVLYDDEPHGKENAVILKAQLM